MKKTAFFRLARAAAALLATRGAFALDFAALSRPLPFSEVKAPAVPAPERAARPGCRPFLLSVSVGGVGEKLIMERVCTPENEAAWALVVEETGRKPVRVKVTSTDHPADRARIEARVKSMVLEGATREDADFIVMKLGPLLRDAAAAPEAEQPTLLSEAAAALKAYLARP